VIQLPVLVAVAIPHVVLNYHALLLSQEDHLEDCDHGRVNGKPMLVYYCVSGLD